MRKTILFVAGTATALVAIALPALASADQWYDKSSPLTSNATVTFSGPAGIASEVGGISCTVHVETTLTKGTDVAHVNGFTVTVTTCKGSGLYTGCVVDNSTGNTPWVVTAATPKTLTLTKSGGNITTFTKYEAGCIASTVDTVFPSITATVDSGSEISTLTLEGEGTSNLGAVEISGTLTSTAPKTYGIGA